MNETDVSLDESTIRAVRKQYNDAIVSHDADAIASFLAPDYHVVTGRSDQSHGVEEQRQRWANLFQSDSTVIFHRSPREIRLNEAWGLAEELGDWTGSYSMGTMPVSTAGVYAAKWQRSVNGTWLVQVEVFTTLECSAPDHPGLGPAPITLPPSAQAIS